MNIPDSQGSPGSSRRLAPADLLTRAIVTFTLALSGTATAAASPPPPPQEPEDARHAEMLALDEMIGAEILATGSEPVAKVVDVVVDTETARIGPVVIQVGEEHRQLAYAELSPLLPGRAYRVELRPDEIEELPPSPARPLDTTASTDEKKGEKTGEGGDEKGESRERETEQKTKPAEAKAGASEKRAVPSLGRIIAPKVAASSMRGTDVLVTDRRFGTVENLVFDAPTGTLAFLEIQAGTRAGQRGDVKWVPWGACRIHRPERDGREIGKSVVVVDPKGRALEDAPGPGSGVLTDPLFRARLYRFFDLESPAYEDSGDR